MASYILSLLHSTLLLISKFIDSLCHGFAITYWPLPLSLSALVPPHKPSCSFLGLLNFNILTVQLQSSLQESVPCECLEHILMIFPAHRISTALECLLGLGTKAPESSVEQKDLLSASALECHDGTNVLQGEGEVGW